jgi:hypothetical protein
MSLTMGVLALFSVAVPEGAGLESKPSVGHCFSELRLFVRSWYYSLERAPRMPDLKCRARGDWQ